VAQQRFRTEHDRDVVLAWHIMYIKVKTQNDKRMPSLKRLLAPQEGPRAQKAALYQLSAQLGVPVVRQPRG
jgi:hypothetical protein